MNVLNVFLHNLINLENVFKKCHIIELHVLQFCNICALEGVEFGEVLIYTTVMKCVMKIPERGTETKKKKKKLMENQV